MNPARTPSLSRTTRPWSQRLIAAAIALLALSVLVADAHAAKRKSRKPQAPQATSAAAAEAGRDTTGAVPSPVIAGKDRFNETVQRYLPDNCQAFGWIDVAPVLTCPIGGANFEQECQEKFGPLAVRPDRIETVVYGGGSLADGGVRDIVAIVFCNQPVPAVDTGDLRAHAGWSTIEVGSETVWVKDGPSPWAACCVDERVVIVGHPTPVGEVLSRRAATKLPERLEQARRSLDSTAPFAMAFLPDKAQGSAVTVPFPTVAGLADQVEAVCIELRFDDQIDMEMTAFCHDAQAAQQLHHLAMGMTALIQMQDLKDQEPAVRQLLQSIRLNLNGPQLTANMKFPAAWVSVSGDESNGVGAASGLMMFPVQHAPAGICDSETVPPSSFPSSTAPPTCVPPPTTSSPYSPVPPGYASPYAPLYPSPGPGPFDPYATGPQPLSPAPGHFRTVTEVAAVIRLVEAGVDDQVIITFLQRRCLQAELTVDDLIDLTKAEASTSVITKLQQLPIQPAVQPPSSNSEPSTPVPANRPA